MGPKHHERDCSDYALLNQVPFVSTDAYTNLAASGDSRA